MVLKIVNLDDGTQMLGRASFFEDNGAAYYGFFEHMFSTPPPRADDFETEAHRDEALAECKSRQTLSRFAQLPNKVINRIVELVPPSVPGKEWGMPAKYFENKPCTKTLFSLALTSCFFYELLKHDLSHEIAHAASPWLNQRLVLMDADPESQDLSMLEKFQLDYDEDKPIHYDDWNTVVITELPAVSLLGFTWYAFCVQALHDTHLTLLDVTFGKWLVHTCSEYRKWNTNKKVQDDSVILRNLTKKQYVTRLGLKRVEPVTGAKEYFLGIRVDPREKYWTFGQAVMAMICWVNRPGKPPIGSYDGWAGNSFEIIKDSVLMEADDGSEYVDVSTKVAIRIEEVLARDDLTLFPEEGRAEWMAFVDGPDGNDEEGWDYCPPAGRIAKRKYLA